MGITKLIRRSIGIMCLSLLIILIANLLLLAAVSLSSRTGGRPWTMAADTAAALGELFEMGLGQIGYAAEVAMEHHLGLTCDPICGLVQIPCIERNAVAAARALDANSYANLSDGHHMISYDRVVEVMKETGKDIPSLYRETSEGGLARNYTQK